MIRQVRTEPAEVAVADRERLVAEPAVDEWQELDEVGFYEEAERLGWGDGLPLVAPTEARMEAFLAEVDRGPDDLLGLMPPAEFEVTPAKVAANAIMAGCEPRMMRVVLASISALLEDEFNLSGIQSTTHPVAPLTVVHGPASLELGFHGGPGLFGPGNRTNATVGRAIRLCLLNLGGARPGELDRATHGQPSKYSYCVTENLEDSPWRSYAEEVAGLGPADDAVTVCGVENPHNVNDHVSTDAYGILSTVASSIATMGANTSYISRGAVVVVLGPEHADTVASSGFTRRDVQSFLFEEARLPVSQLRKGGMWGMKMWSPWLEERIEKSGDDGLTVPVVNDPDGFEVFVAGGPGKHSVVMQGFGGTQAVTRTFDELLTREETA